MLTCNVILQLLGNKVGFFQQNGEIQTGNSWSLVVKIGNLYGSVRSENDKRRLQWLQLTDSQIYITHFFFDFKWNLDILVNRVK
jgi:hypothetical protein